MPDTPQLPSTSADTSTFSPLERATLQSAVKMARDPRFLGPVQTSQPASSYGWDALQSAAQLGLLGIRVPVEAGGLGHSFRCMAAFAEIVARIDFGVALALMNTSGVAAKLSSEASPSVVSRLLPSLLKGDYVGCTALTEPGAGSDFAAIVTHARKTAGGWTLTGQKAWITNAAVARVIIVYAQTEPGSGARGIASFVIDAERSGFLREPAYELAVPNTLALGGFSLHDYQAGDDEMLQAPGVAFKAALTGINAARTYVAAIACGMVAECLDLASVYGAKRRTFDKLLAEHQGWRWPIADASTDLTAAQHLVDSACHRIDAGQNSQTQAAKAKLFAARMAEFHIPALSQAMGAEGLRKHYPFGRHQLGARACHLVDGSSEMMRERIVANMMRPRVLA